MDIYKTWLRSWMNIPKTPEWVREPHSWQQIQLNDPEDEDFERFLKTLKDYCRLLKTLEDS